MAEYRIIDRYVLLWVDGTKSGQVVLLFNARDPSDREVIEVKSITELEAIGSILRNERPVAFDSDRRILSTTPQLVGEG